MCCRAVLKCGSWAIQANQLAYEPMITRRWVQTSNYPERGADDGRVRVGKKQTRQVDATVANLAAIYGPTIPYTHACVDNAVNQKPKFRRWYERTPSMYNYLYRVRIEYSTTY